MRTDINIETDPYSWAMVRIVGTLKKATDRGRDGTMSEAEFNLLKGIQELILDNDPEALDMPVPKSIVLRS